MIDFSNVVGVDWDAGNDRKNERHGVSRMEAEQVFFDPSLQAMEDTKHSETEQRYIAFGSTESGRTLQIALALRLNRMSIRIISARDMNRRERKIYENQN